MNRRGFLKLLGLAAPAAVVAPKYFFAPVGGWKSDVIVNPGGCLTVEMIREFQARMEATLGNDFYPPDGGICGGLYWQMSPNSGTMAGIGRGTYPGRLHV